MFVFITKSFFFFFKQKTAYEMRISDWSSDVCSSDLLDANEIDFIITDINMPVMDGITFIKELRKKPKNKATPVLILTTESSQAKKQEGRAAGATGWIVKPFDPGKLLEVIRKVSP